ncbi:hypothetical protein L9F63_023301, partial [Diploptera punctata]
TTIYKDLEFRTNFCESAANIVLELAFRLEYLNYVRFEYLNYFRLELELEYFNYVRRECVRMTEERTWFTLHSQHQGRGEVDDVWSDRVLWSAEVVTDEPLDQGNGVIGQTGHCVLLVVDKVCARENATVLA